MVTLLVEAAQLEVLDEDLRKVMVDAIDEQNEWNRFQVVDGKESPAPKEPSSTLPPFVFQPGSGYLDPLVAGSAAEIRVAQFMAVLGKDGNAPARPITTGLGIFFKNTYKVGSETLLRDIPTLVLLETLTRALLVVRTCVLGLFGSEAPRLRSNPLYRFGLDWPLRALHALISLARRKPGWGLGVFIGLGAVSVLALATGIVWWRSFWHSLPGVITFVVAPLVILGLQAIFLLWGAPWLLRRWGIGIFFVTLISAAALAFGIPRWEQLNPFTGARSLLGFIFLIALPGIVIGSESWWPFSRPGAGSYGGASQPSRDESGSGRETWRRSAASRPTRWKRASGGSPEKSAMC